MHAASSTRILPQEQRSANFSTSRATVPKQHSRLKKYKHYKKISLSPSCSLPLISLCSSICLSPSLRQSENIIETSAATLLISHTSLYHLHPNRQTASILSYQCILHLWSPIISHPCYHLWYVYRKPPHTQWPHICLPGHIIPIIFGFITAYMQVYKHCKEGLQLLLWA